MKGNRFGPGFWVGGILVVLALFMPGAIAAPVSLAGLTVLLPTLIALGIDKDRAYIAAQAQRQTQAPPPPPPDAPGFGG